MGQKNSIERSLCSPSQLERRYLCPGSANLEKQFIEVKSGKTNEAAKRGVFLHDATERLLQGTNINDIAFDYDGDKIAVQWSFDRVLEIKSSHPKAIIKSEIQVDLADLGIESGEKGNRIDLLFVIPNEKIIIIDFKFGEFWSPPPQYSWQFKGYSYGAMRMFGGQEVQCVKLQPELPEEYRYMEHTFTLDAIKQIGEDIKKIVENTKSSDAPLVRGETQCQFCKAEDICPQHRGTVLSIPQHVSIASHLYNISPAERGKLYADLNVLEKWAKKALATINGIAVETGMEMAGYEVGHGRSRREWDDPDSALMSMKELALRMGIPDNKLTVPETGISPSEADKVFGKSQNVQSFLSKLYTTVEGKLTLKKVKEKK